MNDVNIPLIVVHKGDAFYLDYVLKQARLFNKNANIYLLGDEKNNRYKDIQHCMIDDYNELAQEFEKVYEHMSSNLYGYELFCFQRWFIILDFVRKNKIEQFLCLDSDVLLFCNIQSVFSQYINKCDFTICNGYHPGFNLFSEGSLSKFCSYMLQFYQDTQNLNRLRERYQSFIINKKLGGNCDMTIIEYYIEKFRDNVIDIGIPKKNVCFDGGISASYNLFEMENGIKKIYWKNELPYFKLIENGNLIFAAGLHLDGKVKFQIHKFALDSAGKHRNDLLYNLQAYMSFRFLKLKIARYKRGLTKLLKGNIINLK